MTALLAALERSAGTDPDARLVATAGALRDAAAAVPPLVGRMLQEEADWYASLAGDPKEVARCGMTGWSHGRPLRAGGRTHPVPTAILLLDAGRGGDMPRSTDPIGTVRRWEVTGALLRFDPHIAGLPTHHPHPCRIAAGRLSEAMAALPARSRRDADRVVGELRNAASTLRAVPQHAIQQAAVDRARSYAAGAPTPVPAVAPRPPAGQPSPLPSAVTAEVAVDETLGRLVGRPATRTVAAAFSALVDAPVSLMPHDTAARIGGLVATLFPLR